MQLPLGLEASLQGVVDLVAMEAVYFDGPLGQQIRRERFQNRLHPTPLVREKLLDAVSMFSDELTEAILEGQVTQELIVEAIRKATVAQQITPVFLGSAYKNRGVQALLDGITAYLPALCDREQRATSIEDGHELVLGGSADGSLVLMAFKVDDVRFGQLTYVRVYDGTLRRASTLLNMRTQKKNCLGRLVRMHD